MIEHSKRNLNSVRQTPTFTSIYIFGYKILEIVTKFILFNLKMKPQFNFKKSNNVSLKTRKISGINVANFREDSYDKVR